MIGFLTLLSRALYLFPLATMPRTLPLDPHHASVVLVATLPNKPFPVEWIPANHHVLYLHPEKTISGPETEEISSLAGREQKKQRYQEWSHHLQGTYSFAEYISLEHDMARMIDCIAMESYRRHTDTTIFLSYLWLHPHSIWSQIKQQDKILIASPYLDEIHTPYGDMLYLTESEIHKNIM